MTAIISAREIRHLGYLCVLAEQLHFTKVALLNAAQPALNHQIRQLEQKSGRNWWSAPTGAFA
jgi:DNA-binding transcriptional LysR family regulator